MPAIQTYFLPVFFIYVRGMLLRKSWWYISTPDHDWTLTYSSAAVFYICSGILYFCFSDTDPDPLKLVRTTDPDPAYSSGYYVSKWKISSFTYVCFFSLVTSSIYLPLRDISVSNVAFPKNFLPHKNFGRWVGSGSGTLLRRQAWTLLSI
jgi:hypothetical protein